MLKGVSEAMTRWPGFHQYGIRWCERHAEEEGVLRGGDFAAQVKAAARFLALFRPRKSRPQFIDSYQWKHSAERAAGIYITNGALICAALDIGLHVEEIPCSPNAWVYVSERLV